MKPMFNMLNNISLSFVFVFRPLEHLNWQDKILCFYLSRHPKKVSNVALIINIRDWLFNVLISVVCCQLNHMSHGKDNFPLVGSVSEQMTCRNTSQYFHNFTTVKSHLSFTFWSTSASHRELSQRLSLHKLYQSQRKCRRSTKQNAEA